MLVPSMHAGHPTTGAALPDAFEITRAREEALSRVLISFVTTGLVFMMLPGTFLGVWNLMQISGRGSAASVSPAWVQAHGHAQVFGWIGSFILGIGFYSIPKLRGAAAHRFTLAWACWAMWTAGVTLRWLANVYAWEWRVLLPVSAVLELVAFLFFFRVVSRHRPEKGGKNKRELWIWMVISASIGLMLALIGNLAGNFYVALRGSGPAWPHAMDQRFLTLLAWGFLVPFVWGFSAKWMPVFLGLKPLRPKSMLSALAANWAGVFLALAGLEKPATVLLVAGAVLSVTGLRMFEGSANPPKTRGVHVSFPFFVRMAYAWLVIAALLGVAATIWDFSGGFWGASRHALTVGFIAAMVFCVGQRVLPSFAGMRVLWSTRLMFAALALLAVGCSLRASCEILAYQNYANWAWSVLPASAIVELVAISAFAMNMAATFILEGSHAQPLRSVAQ
jgi:uncharacterized protein involved in response to NO